MIKNLIFDLGGVIYDIRYENIADTFAGYGFPNFTEQYTQAAQSAAIDLFEEGHCSVEEFRAYIRRLSPVELTDRQIDDAWNAILIDVPEERVQMLQQLGKSYRIFLFSNTNELNYNKFKKDLQNKFGIDIFDTIFVKSYFSHQMHLRKPHPEAFMQIIQEQGLIPQETLFIDDTERHVRGAESVGLHAYHLRHGEDITEKKWMRML